MHILSVKPVLQSEVNLHQLLSDGAAFTTQSRSSLTVYAKKMQTILLHDYEIEEIVCDNDSCLRSFSVNYGYAALSGSM